MAVNLRSSLAAAALIAALPLALRAGTPNAAGAPVGTTAPAFTARSLDGHAVAPASFAGRVLVLNFWATWCPPCRAETPDLVAAYKKLRAPDVAFLGVDTTETAPVVKTFLSSKGVPYETALAGPDAYNRYGVSFIPTTVVVDARGVVRARWIGGVTSDQLAQYVASAREGKNSEFLTEAQKHIDAMLDPSRFVFGGEASAVRSAVAQAQKRIDDVDAYTAGIPADKRYDYDRTNSEEGTLLEAAGTAALGIAATPGERLNAHQLLATAYADLNRFADSAQAYRDALALKPNDPALTYSLSRAYYRLHDYDAMAVTARAYVKLKPNDPDGYDELGLAYQRLRRFAEAVAPYRKCLVLMIAQAKPLTAAKRGDAYGLIADESLDVGDVYVSLGDRANAQRTFDSAIRYAAMVPPKSRYAAMRERTPERAAEGMAAVALAHGTGTALSLSKWTGPDLPGSLKSTYKYRLIVVAPASKNVTLAAQGVRSGWVASFCADGLCSPKTVSFVEPSSGVKTYEFQLVPPSDGALPGKVAVSAGAARAEVP
jgi:cytochrome c biogenesis protein CcmG/thiol:disulfide interchange protein DsbE